MTKFSMFETLMSLPLFKGASHEQISLFVEKTHLSFKNYNPGENIASASSLLVTTGAIWCKTLKSRSLSGDFFRAYTSL